MSTPSALVIIFDGVEELEAVAPIDILRRAGVAVMVASTGEGLEVTGRSGIRIRADLHLQDALNKEYDCLLIPGGPGHRELRGDLSILQAVKTHASEDKIVAAICAAPTILADAGVLAGKRYTAHPSVAPDLPDIIAGESVVVDGRIITSPGAGAATAFALAVAAALAGQEVADEVAASIVCPGT